MTPELQPYPEYKPSGVEWLGAVPKHWDVARLGRIGAFSKCSGGSKEDETNEGIPCVRYGDLYTSYEFSIRHSCSFISEEKATGYTSIKYGDVLFAGSGETIDEIGRSAVNLIETQLRCGGDVILFRPGIQMDARFSGYALASPQAQWQKSRMGRGITIMHIYGNSLKYLWLNLPPLSEQVAIACYLDYVDSRIQRYISAKVRLVELLTEQKQAVINQAVTRGLDPNVPLKPSGVEWLGDVPAHWEVNRAKYFYREVDERSGTGTEELMSVSHKTGVTSRKKSVTMFMAESNVGHKICRPGDIAINTMWAYMAALGIARQVGMVSPSYGIYRPRGSNGFHPDYIDPLLRTEGYRSEYLCRSTGITSSRLRLYPDSFLGIPLLRPPFDEQIAIVEYLDKATADIDTAIDRSNRQIELMQEYRTRLIADVVTGKLDVRGAVADEIEMPTP